MKITKDSYVDVSDWTEEQVEKAAKMFAKVGGGPVGDIDVGIPNKDYKYLMILGDEAFVGCIDDLHTHGCVKELTKQDIFEEQPPEWNGKGLPPVGTECECITDMNIYLPCEVIAHGVDYVIVHFHPNEYGEKVDWTRTGCRPIKSEKDKEIEKIMNMWEDAMPLEAFAERLYENGFRFVEN